MVFLNLLPDPTVLPAPTLEPTNPTSQPTYNPISPTEQPTQQPTNIPTLVCTIWDLTHFPATDLSKPRQLFVKMFPTQRQVIISYN